MFHYMDLNRVRQIDASTKRRFTYSIEFTALPPRAIREHTVNKLAPFGLAASTVEEIASIAARSGLNAASVTFLAEAVAALPKNLLADTAEAKGELLRRVKSIFDANSRLITGTVPFRTKTGSAYSVAALNTSVDATKIVEAISRYYDAEERGLDLETGLRILLYGESGTGKTEFARYIAETLGRPLLIKRASDILSPWVGISEQQVAEIFREAEETRSILLLDEADSFFSSRKTPPGTGSGPSLTNPSPAWKTSGRPPLRHQRPRHPGPRRHAPLPRSGRVLHPERRRHHRTSGPLLPRNRLHRLPNPGSL